jgi:DNA-binding response OmpR family regulator
MNGMDAATEIRRLGFTGALIGLTGYGERDQIEDFTNHGADYVMIKPIKHEEFLLVTSGTIRRYNLTFIIDAN